MWKELVLLLLSQLLRHLKNLLNWPYHVEGYLRNIIKLTWMGRREGGRQWEEREKERGGERERGISE